MTAWTDTTRCTRCLDVIEPGAYHRCSPRRGYEGLANPKPPTPQQIPKPKPPRSDPATLRAMAERWEGPKAPDARVTFFCDGRAVVYSPGYLLRLVADAMEEAE